MTHEVRPGQVWRSIKSGAVFTVVEFGAVGWVIDHPRLGVTEILGDFTKNCELVTDAP